MFRNLQSRLMLFFLIISLSGIILVSLAIHFSFFGSFQDYLETKRVGKVETVVERLENEYLNNGRITGRTLTSVFHNYAMVDQLFFAFYDNNGSVIFDTTSYSRMMEGMPRGRMMDQYDYESLEKESYPVSIGDQQIGSLIVYYPLKYVDIDSQFLQQFKKHIILAALAMIFISIIVSFFLSKRLAKPLRQVADATKELQNHNLNIRVPEKNEVEEINQLAISFNELAESLSKQEQLRKQFTNDMAHELRTPLATLRSQNEALLDGIWEPTPERLKQGHEELMRLVRLVDDLEQLLAAENPQIRLHVTEVNAKKIIQSLQANFQQAFQDKNISLVIEEPKNDLYFNADRDRIMQIMINLLNNALKYTQEGGEVTLQLISSQRSLSFVIEDNGEGISREDLPHIFERFYRGEKSRNRKTGGVGIGLSIVKALVDAQGGKINIESEKNKGSKVTVSFKLK